MKVLAIPSASSANTLAAPQIVGEKNDRLLTRSEFFGLADLPPEHEWFAGIDNLHTRRACRADLTDFMSFAGIQDSIEFRIVTRGHILAWRKSLEVRTVSGATIRRKMVATSSLFEYLCEKNAVESNPVRGAKRPRADSNEGPPPSATSTPVTCSSRRRKTPSKTNAPVPFFRCFCIKACAVKSWPT